SCRDPTRFTPPNEHLPSTHWNKLGIARAPINSGQGTKLIRHLFLSPIQVNNRFLIPFPDPGFMYLTAVIDWFSRYVLSWRLSNTLEGAVLPGGAGRGVGDEPAGDLQHRPGVPVHSAGVHWPPGGGRDRGEPGRSGAGAGQRVRRAAVEERK